MAKRFTDSSKFSSPLLRSLQGPYKLLWLYMEHTCDHAGFWDVELDIASARCKFDYSEEECLRVFGQHIVPVADGAKWFMPAFVYEQYGLPLNETNRVHQSVINSLKKFLLYDDNNKQPLSSPLQGACKGAKDKDKEMDKDRDKAKDSEGGAGGNRETIDPSTWQVHPATTGEGDHTLDAGQDSEQEQDITQNTKVTRLSMLPLEDCLQMLVKSPRAFCQSALEELVRRCPEFLEGDSPGINITKLLLWGNAFNRYRITELETEMVLFEYTRWFTNWLAKQDRSQDPQKLFANANSNGAHTANNTNRAHGAQSNRGGRTAASHVIPQGSGAFD